MGTVVDLFTNKVFLVAILGWFIAQTMKIPLNYIKTKKWDFRQLWASGGMPSSHTACVVGTTIAIARVSGVASPLFALSFMMASVVVHDAMGVRRAAGEQAKVINEIIKLSKDNKFKDKEALKEVLGHTPLEVLGGGLLGILIAMVMPI